MTRVSQVAGKEYPDAPDAHFVWSGQARFARSGLIVNIDPKIIRQIKYRIDEIQKTILG